MTKGNGRFVDPKRQEFERRLIALMPFLRAFAKTLAGGEAGEDLAQEALCKAIHYRNSFSEGSNLKAWLFTIARNHFYSERRRSWRTAPWNAELAEKLPALSVSSAEDEDELRRLLCCLAALPKEQADALIAVGACGYKYDEAAQLLQCAVGTVKSRVARARPALRTLMDSVTEVKVADLEWFRTAVLDVPPSHPFYSIAREYSAMYNEFITEHDAYHTERSPQDLEQARAWRELVASGALEEDDVEWEE